MDDYFIDKSTDTIEDPTAAKFVRNFDRYQNIIKNISGTKYTNVITVETTTIKNTNHEKTRKRVTPLYREKPTKPAPSPAANDIHNNNKFKTNLEYLLNIICSKRDLKDTILYKYTIDFISTYNIKFPKNNDKMILCILYCITMSCRLNDIYLDIRLLSIELNISYKDIIDAFDDLIPSVTDNNDNTKRLLSVIYKTDKIKLLNDYKYFLKQVIPGFKVPNDDTVHELTQEDVELYTVSCRDIFNMMDIDIKCEYERQFCVTPDKVYIYAMFIILKTKHRHVTERYICDYLAGKFQIPRVTIEKMKRLVTKCKTIINE